ncbi:MAG TPA: phosphodiesterase [Verrucomicrobia bacterium]|nr:phosphodiesterase [Verrucomicrobiota bacterium]
MRIVFISDIHGVRHTLEQTLREIDALGYDKIVLLGDLLYHGPRNGVPEGYDPQGVVELLNARREYILAVRGNCDAEVDQMLLKFPMMSEYALLEAEETLFFLTHGHIWNAERLPFLPRGGVFVQGHTHRAEKRVLANGVVFFNPGSVSLPKGGTPRSYGYFDGRELRLIAL